LNFSITVEIVDEGAEVGSGNYFLFDPLLRSTQLKVGGLFTPDFALISLLQCFVKKYSLL
jgi:hypothetical protein